MIINADELYIYIKDASMEISDEKELGEKRWISYRKIYEDK